MRGVPRRDHPQVSCRFGERGRGLCLQDLTLQSLLLLLQALVDPTSRPQLIRALRGIRGQPQRQCQTYRERRDHHDDEGHTGDEGARAQVDFGQPVQAGQYPLTQRDTNDFGRLGFAGIGASLGLAGALRRGGPRRRRGGRAAALTPLLACRSLRRGAFRSPGPRRGVTGTVGDRATVAPISTATPAAITAAPSVAVANGSLTSTPATYTRPDRLRLFPPSPHQRPLSVNRRTARRRTAALR